MSNQSKRNVETLDAAHLQTLYTFSLNMNSSLDFNTVLNNFMDSVMDITKAQRGFVMIDEGQTGNLKVIVARGLDNDTLSQEGYSTTIVNQVAQTREPLLTNNAQFDDRYKPGESIIIRGLRAILCAPMVVQDRLLGAVYVDTSMARPFTPGDLGLLNAVCGLAGTAIENARLYKVAIEKGRMERELQMARDIQQGLLPTDMPQVEGYEVTTRWRSAREVAGDFYDVFKLEDNNDLGVVIADVSDKGAPAAMFMAVARTMIRSHAHTGVTPVETLARTNDLILKDAESGMFVTVYHSVFESNGQSTHVNAGHNPPILFRYRTKELHFLPRGGRAIGWFPNNPLKAVNIQMEPGDLIIYYTDGLTEAENLAGDFFGEDRLQQLIMQNYHLPIEALSDAILASVDEFVGDAPPFDDLTLVAVRYLG